MKAITVQNPWAWLIAIGVKDVENRGRNTNYRGPIAIHAGKRWSIRGGLDERVIDALSNLTGDETPEHRELRRYAGRAALADRGDGWPRGAVMAVADLVDCHPSAGCCTPWGEASYENADGSITPFPYHLVLENVRKLHRPVPAIGMLGVPWNTSDDVAEQVERELAAAS